MDTNVQFIKDPAAVLDWSFNWNSKNNGELPWLSPGEVILSHLITVDSGITVVSSSELEGVVKVWLSGGTLGTTYKVTCKITTDQNRVDVRTILIKIVKR